MLHRDVAVWINAGLSAEAGGVSAIQGTLPHAALCHNERWWNSGWCHNVTVILQHCSPDLESFFINWKRFRSLVSLRQSFLVAVSIPQQASIQRADQILCVEQTPQLLSLVTLTEITSAMNSPNTDCLSMPDQGGEYFGSLSCYNQWCLSHCPPHCTGTFRPHHSPSDSCTQTQIKAL